ncbi:hypothetical protein PsYK624_116890 [Phanerochaete sordida]|uniref:Uncharacterized protein n=1 Tax=Phanerochaete sordida TaxID=48140 RepID=A0A9P3GJP3_9APHY|nr:hypothetical protein PsYK624_116890 [Phanerochaete sordida]
MSSTALFSLPFYLWHLYVEHLWNYKAGSWVERTAATFRVMAFLVIAPFAILTMLDVASYVIARTLGVIETTKASTSGAAPLEAGAPAPVPAIHVASPAREPTSDGEDSSGGAATPATPSFLREADNVVAEGNLRLAGVEAFSPAPSAPPSPTLSRRDLGGVPRLRPLTALDTPEKGFAFAGAGGDSGSEENGEGVQVRRRPGRGTVGEENT